MKTESQSQRSAVMARIRSRNTAPEMLIRRLLSGAGVRYRLHRKDIPGTPDIYIPRLRTAIFVNGCFWHGHSCRRGDRQPKTNAKYWQLKIERNKARDKKNAEALQLLGIERIVLWTCEEKCFDAACLVIAGRYRNTASPRPNSLNLSSR